jgi:hypothetical protein
MLEQWTPAAAVLSRTSGRADGAALAAAPAACRRDLPTHELVNGVWQERMRRDASPTIARCFGEAFDRHAGG